LKGGIAQQTLSMDESSIHTLISQGDTVTDKAKVSFFFSLDGSKTESTNEKEVREFNKMVQTAYTTTLGGKPHAINDTLKGIDTH
jgi:hypothetical protein